MDRESGGLTRRDFVVAAGSAVGLAAWTGVARDHTRQDSPERAKVVLFQGDSITDCGRDRAVTGPNRAEGLGTGYPLLVASQLLAAHPGEGLRIFNRGASGNKVPDLESRWQSDTLDLRPDVLSILIGVNDLWHELMGRYHGTVEEYETGYAVLLERTKRELPGARLVVLEPFVLRCGVVNDSWFPEFDRRRAAAARVAQRAGATFVPLHAMFEGLSRQAPPTYWAADGVHPTVAGHGAIADRWMRSVRL